MKVMILILIIVFVVLFAWSACKVAGDYDDWVDEQLQKIQEDKNK